VLATAPISPKTGSACDPVFLFYALCLIALNANNNGCKCRCLQFANAMLLEIAGVFEIQNKRHGIQKAKSFADGDDKLKR
jgi:hypothetical protein